MKFNSTRNLFASLAACAAVIAMSGAAVAQSAPSVNDLANEVKQFAAVPGYCQQYIGYADSAQDAPPMSFSKEYARLLTLSGDNQKLLDNLILRACVPMPKVFYRQGTNRWVMTNAAM
jgi:hypothetical protein